MDYTRRDFGKIALVAVPVATAFAKVNSKFKGVQIGAITYSFNSIASPDPEAIIRAYVEIGLGEAELMSNHCETLAGAPRRSAAFIQPLLSDRPLIIHPRKEPGTDELLR